MRQARKLADLYKLGVALPVGLLRAQSWEEGQWTLLDGLIDNVAVC
jgi:hypothetical protein